MTQQLTEETEVHEEPRDPDVLETEEELEPEHVEEIASPDSGAAEPPPVDEKPEEGETVVTLSPEELATHGFTSTIPFENAEADCLVICCSDQRFRRQNIEFIRALGYQFPLMISLPSGVAIAHSMVAAINFLSKAVHRLLDKAVDLTGVTEIVCIAHEDCGGYKVGKVKLLGQISRRLTGRSVKEIQLAHLVGAVREIQLSLGDVNVRAFYADVHSKDGERRVHYKEVPIQRRRRRRRRI